MRVCKQGKLYKQKLKTTEKVIVKIVLIVLKRGGAEDTNP